MEGKVDWDNGMIVPNSRDIGLSNGADHLSMQRITLINCSKTTRQRKNGFVRKMSKCTLPLPTFYQRFECIDFRTSTRVGV